MNTKISLCDNCKFEIPECLEDAKVEFGDGIGNDNIINCSKFECNHFTPEPEAAYPLCVGNENDMCIDCNLFKDMRGEGGYENK